MKFCTFEFVLFTRSQHFRNVALMLPRLHLPVAFIIGMETVRALSCCSNLLIRACDLMNVFLFRSPLWLFITSSHCFCSSTAKRNTAMRINIIRMIFRSKSDDGRRPDTVMGYFIPVFHSPTQSTVATDILACNQVPLDLRWSSR